jgi:hypothetical protein
MSAADKTSKAQFGWVETTSISENPSDDPYEASTMNASTRIHHMDLSATRPNAVGGRSGDSDASVSAHWSSKGPSLWTEEDIQNEANLEVKHVAGEGQYSLLHAGEREAPTIESIGSTKKGRFAAARGVGIMANLAQQRAGREVEGSTNLSPQSAPMVSKLTGVPHPVTNGVGFREEPIPTLVPDASRPERIEGEWRGEKHTQIHRMIPESEVKAGGQRLKTHMEAMRGPKDKPSGQGKMFAEPPPPTVAKPLPEPQVDRGTKRDSMNSLWMRTHERKHESDPVEAVAYHVRKSFS